VALGTNSSENLSLYVSKFKMSKVISITKALWLYLILNSHDNHLISDSITPHLQNALASSHACRDFFQFIWKWKHQITFFSLSIFNSYSFFDLFCMIVTYVSYISTVYRFFSAI
jgi:hypothetical protein